MMAKMFFAVANGCLRPVCDVAKVFCGKKRADSLVMVEAVAPRNAKQHRLYWAMCAKIADAIPGDYSAENISDLLKLRTGHSTILSTRTGEVSVPKSISFANMKDDEFQAFLDRCMTIVCRDLVPNLSETQARRELLEMIAA
jgi:hypothetical protein